MVHEGIGRRAAQVSTGILALALALPALAADFRGHTWGDTRASVISVEGPPRSQYDWSLKYDATLAGVEMDLSFEFTAGALTGADYTYSLGADRLEEARVTYRTLRDLLVEKYGPATKEDPDAASWETDRSSILMVLMGDEEGSLLMLTYQSLVPSPPPALDSDEELNKL